MITSKVTQKGGFGPITQAVASLVKQRVLVGIPGDTSARPAEPGQPNPINNAVLGYILETGAPAQNIPARPFLVPGVKSVGPQMAAILASAAEKAFTGDAGAAEAGLRAVGLIAEVAVKQTMQAGDFAPLSDRTIQARARRRWSDTGKLKGDKASRDARRFLKLRGEGTPDDVLQGAGLAEPLVDTRSLLTSVTHVLVDNRNKP